MRGLPTKFNVPVRKRNREKGTVLMEAIICLPVLLLVSLGVAQFAHIWLCRTMVQYAAYSAARAALVSAAKTETDQARIAAKAVCAPLAFYNPTDGEDFSLPGIVDPSEEAAKNDGKIIASGAVEFEGESDSENVLTVTASKTDNFHVMAEVKMKVPLLVPLAGPVIGRVMTIFAEWWGHYGPAAKTPDGPMFRLTNDRFPRIELKEQVYMTRPFLITWNEN